VNNPRPAGGASCGCGSLDVGGTDIKAAALDEKGKMTTERQRLRTPRNATPRTVIAKWWASATASQPAFPAYSRTAWFNSAPNLGKGWRNFPLEQELKSKLDVPVRIVNDADVQGLGAVSGRGDELVITLGTGFGSVLFVDGHRIHLELGHHPFHNGKTYEDELGHLALEKKGKRKWNKLLREAIDQLALTFGYDRLYIGGGNTKFIKFELPANVKAVSNEEGLRGGIKLWDEQAGAA
jgi:polyphosphate glucokinase